MGTRAQSVAVLVTETSVAITCAGRKIFGGCWEFKVAPEEDPDWELRELGGRRVLRLTVKKAVMPGGLGVVIWWSRVLKGDPSIDVGQISDRKHIASESFAKAWN